MDVLLASAFTGVYLLVTLRLCKGCGLRRRTCAWGESCVPPPWCAHHFDYPSQWQPHQPDGHAPLLLLSLVYDPRLAFVSGWITGVLACFLLAGWQPFTGPSSPWST